jgi:myo-inositol 2-dehydrogenase/D-chiro-inositol 1-dehydrogenase
VRGFCVRALALSPQIHDFDMARFLVGSEIVEVYTKGDCKIDPAIAEAGACVHACVRACLYVGVCVEQSRRACYGSAERCLVRSPRVYDLGCEGGWLM